MNTILFLFAFAILQPGEVVAKPWLVRQANNTGLSITTSLPNILLPVAELRARQITTEDSTCGYANGDPDQARTADPGFNCRVDTKNALWGFCPTTVISASDCGLAGACVDSKNCKTGCGISGVSSITTFTCGSSAFCSTALLTAGPDQTYSYIACGGAEITDHLLVAPTSESSTSPSTTSTVTPKATPSQATSPPTSSATSSSTTTTTSSSSTSSTSSSPSSTASSTSSSLSATPLAANPSSTSATTNEKSSPTSSPSLVGPIVGGVIGGLALVVFAVLGFLFVRRYRREHPPTPPPKAPSESGVAMLPLQVPGLHELNGKYKDREKAAAELAGVRSKGSAFELAG